MSLLFNELFKRFIIILFYYLFAVNISKLKISHFKIFIAIILTLFIVRLCEVYTGIEIVSSFLIVILISFFIFLILKNITLSFIYSIIATLLYVTVDNFVTILFIYFFNVTISLIRENEVIYWSVSLTSGFITFALSKIVGHFIEKIFSSLSSSQRNKFSTYIFSFLLLTLVIFFTNVYLSTDEAKNSLLLVFNAVLLIIDFIFVVIIFYAFFRAMNQNIEINHKQELLSNLNTYINSLNNVFSEMRGLRHDIKNILSSIQIHMQNDDIISLRKCFDEHVVPLYDRVINQNIVHEQLQNINIPELKAILAMKILSALEMAIPVHIEVYEEINHLDIDIMDLVRITGILLDNAIEECKKKPGLILQFAAVKTKGTIKLVFINETVDEVDISSIFEKDYSSKGNGRGIGLYTYRKILSQYNNISLNTYVKEGNFTQVITFHAVT